MKLSCVTDPLWVLVFLVELERESWQPVGNGGTVKMKEPVTSDPSCSSSPPPSHTALTSLTSYWTKVFTERASTGGTDGCLL